MKPMRFGRRSGERRAPQPTLPSAAPDFGNALDYSLADSYLIRGARHYTPTTQAGDAPTEDTAAQQVRDWIERHPCKPEVRLWIAVIRAAIADYRDSKTAREWLHSPSNDPLSFRWIVNLLGFDPDRVNTAAIRSRRK